MSDFKIGDIVARKSYGGDVYFRIAGIADRDDGTKVYELRGLLYRIFADSHGEDLVRQNVRLIRQHMKTSMVSAGIYRLNRNIASAFLGRVRGKTGRILHVDSSADYLDMCMKFYRQSNIKATGRVIPESEQPGHIRSLLESTRADILVVTGHDGYKKDSGRPNNVDDYRNSKYYIQSVREARKLEPDMDRLCIFGGACQSYYEGLMAAGANFASSPGRILIHALDPAKVGDRVALTDSRRYVTPQQIAEITESGAKGIWGINTKGHFVVEE